MRAVLPVLALLSALPTLAQSPSPEPLKSVAENPAAPESSLVISADGDVLIGDAPATPPHPYDRLTVAAEPGAAGGMSILTDSGFIGSLNFGSPADSVAARVEWDDTANVLVITTATPGGTLRIGVDLGFQAMTIDSDRRVSISRILRLPPTDNPPTCQGIDDEGLTYYDRSEGHLCTCNGSTYVDGIGGNCS